MVDAFESCGKHIGSGLLRFIMLSENTENALAYR